MQRPWGRRRPGVPASGVEFVKQKVVQFNIDLRLAHSGPGTVLGTKIQNPLRFLQSSGDDCHKFKRIQ